MLFGGSLLVGAGGVFGAFLVIVGVLFAAGLFAVKVVLTVILAMVIVCGTTVDRAVGDSELSHLARVWSHALLAVALDTRWVDLFFATAGALSLDATSFTGAARRSYRVI